VQFLGGGAEAEVAGHGLEGPDRTDREWSMTRLIHARMVSMRAA